MVRQSMSHHFWRRISEMIFVKWLPLFCYSSPHSSKKRQHVKPRCSHTCIPRTSWACLATRWLHSSHVTSQYGEIEDAWKQGKSMLLSIDCCAGTLKLDRSLAQSCCATSRAELPHPPTSIFPFSPISLCLWRISEQLSGWSLGKDSAICLRSQDQKCVRFKIKQKQIDKNGKKRF